MSDPLLVPMHLDALVLSNEQEVAETFQLTPPDYTQLELFAPPGPAPFAALGTPQAGIHLHWTLPRPLRYAPDATQSGDGWPHVPNRWVVVRVAGGDAVAEPVKAWIVVSDAPGGTSQFVEQAADGTAKGTTIGTSYVMTADLKADALAQQGGPVLKAIGPGSATFSIFAPHVQDVFALYDDLKRDDGTTIAGGTFTYHVAGWYQDPGDDPLADAVWEPPAQRGAPSVVKDRGFAAFLGTSDPPTWTLVHAMASAVTWDSEAKSNTPAAHYPNDVPGDVRVAVGNTAVDALAALVRLGGDNAAQTQADLLEAFVYGELEAFDKPASSTVLARAIRKHWFGASPGGTRWTVVQPEPPGPTALPTPQAAPLTTAQADALAALNTAQRNLDTAQRILEGQSWTLYALWFKQQFVARNFVVPGIDDSQLDWYKRQLDAQVGDAQGSDGAYLDAVAAQAAEVAVLEMSLVGLIGALEVTLDATTQQLKAATMPAYHAPNDPVVLVTGLGRSSNLDPVGDLTCRLLGQAVSGLTIAGTTHTASEVPPLADPNALLPDGVQALHAEAVLLSPDLCAETVAHGATADDVRAAIAALPAPAADAHFVPAAGSWEAWAQPWVPVLLDWEVTLLDAPAYARAGDAPVHELQQSHWTFDGSDWTWGGTKAPNAFDLAASSSMRISGRTFVTPQLNFTLADRLDDYVRQHHLRDAGLDKLLEQLDATLDGIRAGDVLSQRLSGLRSRIAQRDLTPAPAPPAGSQVATVLDGQPYRGSPLPYPDLAELPVWDFAPAAGTFFVIDRLTVIDFMGRTVDLTLANCSTAVPRVGGPPTENWFYPVAAPGVRSPTQKDPLPVYPGQSAGPTDRMLQLPPGLSQDAQVWFRAIAGDGSHADVDLVGSANPVCGWIVPNHLDRSLALYAPDGTAWGELFLSHQGDGYVPYWQPDPTSATAPQTVADIPNAYTAAMLGALVQRQDQGAALSDFLTAIDETLWGVEPGGPRKDQDLSVLIGRPLAIVRAELALKLRGTVWTSQDWWNTFDADPDTWPKTKAAPLAQVDGGVRDLRWPVRLGDSALRDDGLVGYFLDTPDGENATTWDTCSVVNLPAGMKGDGYLKQIAADGSDINLRFTDDTQTPDPAAAQLQRLTLLIDPRADVHAFTGLLPVTAFSLGERFIRPALSTMSYLFRAGPFLTSPDVVRLPRPAEHKGTWSWFDQVLARTVPIAPADAGTRLPSTPPVALEGWLKLTPNPPAGGDGP